MRPTVVTRLSSGSSVAPWNDTGDGLGHAVADRHFAHVHLRDDALHRLDRARRAGHHAGAQARQIEARELRMIESAMNIVGTPCSAVQRSSLTAANVAPASNTSPGNTIARAGAHAGRAPPSTMPKQWYSGTGMHSESHSLNFIAIAMKRALLTML